MIDRNPTKRGFIAAAAAAGLLATAGRPVSAQAVDLAELNKEGPLGDQVLGDARAPVTIIEYASLTCGHCADFHANGYKVLKEKYIDAGKVRFILREFPLDPLSAAAFMLSRCAGEGKYYPMVDLFFSTQKVWAFSDKPVDALLATARQAGFTQESFEACLRDQKVYDGVNAVRLRGAEKFGIDSTPTFFINGEIQRGSMLPADLEKKLDALTKK